MCLNNFVAEKEQASEQWYNWTIYVHGPECHNIITYVLNDQVA